MTQSGATTPARVDLGAMATKRYFVFPKSLALLKSHYQSVKCHIEDTFYLRGMLTLYSFSRLGK